MKYFTKSILLLALVFWIFGQTMTVVLAFAVLLHAFYRETPRGLRGRIASLDDRIRLLEGDRENADWEASENRLALEKHLRSGDDNDEIARGYRYEIAVAEEDLARAQERVRKLTADRARLAAKLEARAHPLVEY